MPGRFYLFYLEGIDEKGRQGTGDCEVRGLHGLGRWAGQGRAGVEGVQYICTMSWLWDDNSPITQILDGGIGFCWERIHCLGMGSLGKCDWLGLIR